MAKTFARINRAALASIILMSHGVCGGCGGPEDPKQVDQRIAKSLKPGDLAILSNDRLGPAHRNGPVRLYVTRNALDVAIKLAEVKDTAGLRSQAERGETFQVATGTRVVVIRPDPLGLVAEVRIQGGDHANRIGWVPVPQVQP